ncbi:helix-turn-helix transcriptional regulator [Telmatospirillum sp.]|uniref:helix-turn-helix transcriptional regulator n=1 Tax=Telmatospirillum sp. TaxID=2079197 RepID=UPI002846BD76|nr:helix-turn-helix transcriptional regulator [Telmatospirillum sp.]MDR3435645.1 helix-turn-helix transcriptional regulator [Telmatospirillum sp.]
MTSDLNWYKVDIYPGIFSAMIVPDIDQCRALGAFLRAHRERLTPPVARIGRRRTPGLRREEVALACGVSTTWYTWLEQGRDVSASPPALARLAEALCLSPAERAYLFDLAGKRDPAAPVEVNDDLPAHVLALPRTMSVPAYLLDRTWTARSWNDAAERLFTGWLDRNNDRNLLRFIFLSPVARRLIDDWEERGRRVVAEFRADYSRWLHDPAMQTLIDNLGGASPTFLQHWHEQAVLNREGGERRFHHPQDGACRFQQATLLLAAHPDIKLVSLTPIPT